MAEYISFREEFGASGSTENEADVACADRMFVIPSKYNSGNRYLRQNMHENIATSNKVEYSDILLTITFNRQWPGIRSDLLSVQKAVDCSDLCARVF